jgi:hypothetical protein
VSVWIHYNWVDPVYRWIHYNWVDPVYRWIHYNWVDPVYRWIHYTCAAPPLPPLSSRIVLMLPSFLTVCKFVDFAPKFPWEIPDPLWWELLLL